MRALLARLARDVRGVAATEFALLLPILVMFGAGTIEYSRLILLTQKLQSGSFILADLTARDKTLSEAQLQNIFLAIDQVIQPFDFAANGLAIVSSVGVDASAGSATARARWSRPAPSATRATTPRCRTSSRSRPARRSSPPRCSTTSSRSSRSACRRA
jgi:Flp pilus assembly protein TadG